MVPSDFGSPIDASEAHVYVEDYKTLRASLIAGVLPYLPGDAPQDVKDSATFHKSKANAFLFDAALIRSLVNAPDSPPYFAVFLGAIGLNPTVIVTGLKEGPQPNTLVIIREDGGHEQPGILVNVKYPSNANGPIAAP